MQIQALETVKTILHIAGFTALVLAEMCLQKITQRVWFGHGGIINWRSKP